MQITYFKLIYLPLKGEGKPIFREGIRLKIQHTLRAEQVAQRRIIN
jgi:hypothetical protein